jgi:hypothetical protein
MITFTGIIQSITDHFKNVSGLSDNLAISMENTIDEIKIRQEERSRHRGKYISVRKLRGWMSDTTKFKNPIKREDVCHKEIIPKQ